MNSHALWLPATLRRSAYMTVMLGLKASLSTIPSSLRWPNLYTTPSICLSSQILRIAALKRRKKSPFMQVSLSANFMTV